MESKQTNIKSLIATGAILVSIAPLACNGKVCEPSHTPDLLVEGFSYDFYNLQVSGSMSSTMSGTATANLSL